MTTYRKTSLPAPSAVTVSTFDDYADALTYSRSIGAHKPQRRVTPTGLAWAVVTPNLDALNPSARVTYTRVTDMDTSPPVVPMGYILDTLQRIRETANVAA